MFRLLPNDDLDEWGLLLSPIVKNAPLRAFSEAFNRLKTISGEQADTGISLADNMALGLLKSHWLKDAPKDIWIKVWDCFIATRSELDTETFCRLCCKSIAKELKEEKRTIIFKVLLTERMIAFLIKNFPAELFCIFDTVFNEPDELSEEVRIIAKERLD